VIRQHLDARSEDVVVGIGQNFLWRGGCLPSRGRAGRRWFWERYDLCPPGRPDRVPVRLVPNLKELARDRLTGACDDLKRVAGASLCKLTLRDTLRGGVPAPLTGG